MPPPQSLSELSFDVFEWNEEKRILNLEKHKIDFEDVTEVFDRPLLLQRSDRDDEIRFVAVGELQSRHLAVVFTIRDEVCRLISARRARKNEQENYHAAKGGRSP